MGSKSKLYKTRRGFFSILYEISIDGTGKIRYNIIVKKHWNNGGCILKKVLISPSLLAADFACLSGELERMERAGADAFHLDVMDGVFVPNITFGVPVVASIRKAASLPFDLHLMIRDPFAYIEAFADAGANWITFHLESESDPVKTIDLIHRLGKKAGLSVSPGTPAEELLPFLNKLDLVLVMSVEPGFGGQKFLESCLPKIRLLREHAPQLRISVDGGINAQTGKLCREAGADMLVAGSYLFGAENPAMAVRSLKESTEE